MDLPTAGDWCDFILFLHILVQYIIMLIDSVKWLLKNGDYAE
jgi:hypothetical protein